MAGFARVARVCLGCFLLTLASANPRRSWLCGGLSRVARVCAGARACACFFICFGMSGIFSHA